MTAIDVSEDKLHREEPKVLELLLRDQTTRRNIVWATSSYEYLGKSFAPHQPLGRSKVTGVYKNLIQPRSEKHLTEQKSRTKVRAEVFTPTWIVDKQVTIALDSLKELSFEDYIDSKWLEMVICLRHSGVPIEALIDYAKLLQQGEATLKVREDLLREQLEVLYQKKKNLQRSIDRLEHKIGLYESGEILKEESYFVEYAVLQDEKDSWKDLD